MRINIKNILIVFLFSGMFVLTGSQIVKGQEETKIIKTKASPSAQSPLATVPFKFYGNHIYVNVAVNGSSTPLSFILDTGAATSVISLKNMEALKLESTGKIPIRGAGGDVTGQLLQNADLSVVGLKDFHTPLRVAIPLARLEAIGGTKIDGVLGHEFFRNFTVKIDYQNSQIEVFDRNSFKYQGTGEVLPLIFKGRHPHIAGKVSLNGEEEVAGDFVIDIGSSQSLLLTTKFINENKVLDKLSPVIDLPSLGGGVGGEINASMGRIKTLRIGSLEITNPLTTLSQSRRGAVAGSNNYIGNIGTGILKHFDVTFDYKNKEMILEKNTTSFKVQKFNTSGIVARKSKENYKIFGLIKNSPATEAGLQVDDILIKINGVPTSQMSLAEIREIFKEEGKLKLEIKRNNKIFSTELKLRKLL